MFVTAISEPARPPYQARRSAGPPIPALTVTFEITLTGDHLADGANRLLAAVRELAGELGEGAVRITAPRHWLTGDVFDPETLGCIAADGARGATSLARPPLVPVPDPEPVHDDVLYVHPGSRTALRGREPLRLTRLEFDLLLFLCQHPDRAFRRMELLRGVWGYDQTGVRTVDVHVRRLRVKVGEEIPLVTTVHGVGYRLDERAQIVIVREPS